jgi:hypothetical protein
MANRFLSNIRINDAYSLPASDGTQGQVISTDGAGNLSFIDASSGGAPVIQKDDFVGNGVTTQFTLGQVVGSVLQTQVYMDGVYQEKETYSVANDVITFTSAPPNGVSIEVISFTSINFAGDFTVDSLQFTGGTGLQGTVTWNANEETLDLVQNGATLQLGQEIQVHVKNQTGSTIPDGTPVYVTGTLGNSGRLTVAPMIADGSIPAKFFLGVTTENIANGEDGKVTTFGKIRGLNTSMYTEGQTLFVSASTAGAFQTTAPVSPNLDLETAIVINSHANNGTLFVRAQNGYYLGMLHDVAFSGLADKDLLVYNSTTGVWENSKTLGDITTGNITTSGTVDGVDVSAFKDAYDTHNHDDRYYTETEIDTLLTNKDNWDTAYSWGDHALAGYLTTETDPVFSASAAAGITSTQITNWDTAYGWGDHSTAGYLTSVTNISGHSATLYREDNRTISPSELSAGQMRFGFTSWNNNDGAPYADFLHFRSYTDHTGGDDNLVTFLKSGIGMRIWQQSWGSATDYSSYVDVWTSGNFSSTDISNWDTAYGWGNHAGLYLPIGGKAADSELLDGVDSSRVVFGTNETKSIVFDNGNINNAIASGFYDGANITGAPSADYHHVINSRHSNPGNNYAMQIAGNFFSESLNYRQITNNVATPWRAIIHSGNIASQSVSYASTSGDASSLQGRVVGNSTDNVAFLGSTRNLVITNPEAYTGEVRLGAAWDYGGVYASSTLTMASSSDINFVINNAVHANLTTDYFSHNGKILMGTFPQSTTNSGAAWIGRAADRALGTMTVQLGGDANRTFEVVDHAWSVVTFNVNGSGTASASESFRAPTFYDSNDTGFYINPNGTSTIRKTNIRALGSSWDAGLNLYSNNGSDRWNLLTDEGASNHLRIAYNNVERIRIQTDGEIFTIGTGKAGSDYRAPIFYDSNDTGYYIDPTNNSRLAKLRVESAGNQNGGNIKIGGGGEGATKWSVLTGSHYNDVSESKGVMLIGSYSTDGSNRVVIGGDIYEANPATQIDFHTHTAATHSTGGTKVAGINNSQFYHISSVRSPIFYDNNDTAYYVDPASTSNFSGLTVASQISGSISGASNALASTGYGNGNFTWRQDSAAFNVFNGWHNYLISNHGDGSSYYNTIIAMPFWGPPRYSRLEGGPQRGPYEFWTSERNIDSGYDVRATSFYDSNNTAYYVDPAGLTSIYALECAASADFNSGVYFNDTVQFTDKVGINVLAETGVGLKIQGGSNGGHALILNGGGFSTAAEIYFPSSASGMSIINNGFSGQNAISFRFGSGSGNYVGGILINTSSTTYATSSDYRLKENIVPMTGSLDRLMLLKPSRFNFIGDEKVVDGFIAHEAQEVVPEAVTGEKDKIGWDGNPEYQGIDQSKLVPLLVGAIQELKAEVEALKRQLNGAN